MHSGPGAPVVTFRWYFTDLPMIDGVTAINNRVFDKYPWKTRPVGELGDDFKQWEQDGARPRPRGLTGHHLCHPEWFRTGEPWPTTLPDTHYNADGIPLCCGVLVDEASVPVGVTIDAGEVGPWVVSAAVPVGVTVLGGDVTPGVSPARVPVALSVTAGEVGPWVVSAAVPVAVTIAAGDGTLGGSSSPVPVAATIDAGEVGPWVDEAAVPVAVTIDAGEVGPWVIDAAVPVGVTVLAGDMTPGAEPARVPVAVTVSAGEVGAWVIGAAVPVAVTVTAVDVIAGGTPAPGTDCSGAPVLATGTGYAWVAPANAVDEQWWRWDTPGGGAFAFTTTDIDGVAVVGDIYEGASCGALSLITSILVGVEFVIVTADHVWLRVTSPTGAGTPYTFRVD